MDSKDAAEQHGREVAARLLEQAKRYDLGPHDIAVMFTEDLKHEALTLASEGLSADEIQEWATVVHEAFTARIRQQGEEAG